MMDLRELISAEQKSLIDRYIETYAVNDNEGGVSVHYDRRADVDTILKPWNKAKLSAPLGFMFQDGLIKTEEIQFLTPEADLRKALDNDSRVWEFCEAFQSWARRWERQNNATQNYDSEAYRTYDALWSLTHYETLIANRYDGETAKIKTPDGHELIIAKGCKPVKMLGKINAAFQISEKFEAFRIAVSMCLNVKTIKGTLCLSIHPMDFMTMSDNDCDWDSCMSWRNWGSYRQGTVEMMNSPFVCVAYLAASEPMHIFGQEWSNKKWRSLYIVHPDFIGNVKGYPYQIPEIDKMVIEKLKAMMKQAGFNAEYGEVRSYEYEGNGEGFPSNHGNVELEFNTNYMYNDFGTITHYGCVREDDKATNRIRLGYSGMSECMWCGHEYQGETEEGLACDYCYEETHCDCCGERMHSTSLFETGEGDWVCESCLCEYYSKSFDDDCYYRTDNMSRVTVVPDEFKEAIACGDLRPEKFDWDMPYILDHYCGSYLAPDDQWAVDRFKRFLNDGAELQFYVHDGWYGKKYIPYIYLSDLKLEWKKAFVERYGYCEETMGDNFYNQWRWLEFAWATDEAAKHWTEYLEEKVPA